MYRKKEDLIRALRLHNGDIPTVSIRSESQVGPATESSLPLRSPFINHLRREGFRLPFQEYRPPYLLERWDDFSGVRYKLVAYNAAAIYASEDVKDPLWKELTIIAFRGENPTIVFTSEDWYRLRINNPTGNIGDFTQLLSPEETPKTRGDWHSFTAHYVPPVPVPVSKGTRMILEDGRAGRLMFMRTFRSAPSEWADYVDELNQWVLSTSARENSRACRGSL